MVNDRIFSTAVDMSYTFSAYRLKGIDGLAEVERTQVFAAKVCQLGATPHARFVCQTVRKEMHKLDLILTSRGKNPLSFVILKAGSVLCLGPMSLLGMIIDRTSAVVGRKGR